MFKTIFFIFSISSSYGAVTVRWMTVASVAIDDGKTKILFDPAWTRPGLKNVIGLENLKSDATLVRSILQKNELLRLDAVFASHSHFDHVIDAPMVSKIAGAVFYTDESSDRIANAYQDKSIRTIRMVPYQKIRVGNFLITPLPRKHSQILDLFDFLPGHVPAQTDLNFWDYHVGDTWFFLIEHPEGSILLDQGSQPYVDTVKKFATKVDVLIQGVANRKSDDDIINGYLKIFSSKFFMPLHFDNFFADFDNGRVSDLPGVGLDELLTKIKLAFPQTRVDRPVYGRPVVVLEINR